MPERTAQAGGRSRLRLLGGWQLLVEGVEVPLNHREQRLTALLGLTGRSSRAHVSGMLWPESTDARALASLRRAVLQTQKRSPGLLQADRTDLGLDPAVEVDVDEVRRAAGLTELPMPGRDAEVVLAALVGEPLLPAWYDDWVLAERERIEQMRVRALERIARHALEMGDLVQAIDAARAAVDIDPLLDSARELAIRAHLGQGDRGSALREFHRYRDAMSNELGVAPSSSILALVEPVIAADGGEEAPRRIEPAAGRAAPVVVPRPRTELGGPLAPIPPIPAPRVPPAHDPASTGARGAAGRLLAVAALVLAASLALAGGGPDAGDGGSDGQGAASLQTGNVPPPGLPGVTAGSRPADDSSQAREVMVRRVDAAYGSAAFVVRATMRPALVRVVMRGPSGRSVARGVVVRSQGGRRLVLDGLDPGTYRWLVTSPTATPVSGRVTVADQADQADQADGVAATPSPTPGPTPGPTAPSTASAQPAPTAQPTPSPQPTPTSQPATNPTPAPHPTPKPTPQPSPTETPTDPGTVAPTPVG
jgi:DNA-binding SARP family transcriptional activator